MPSVPHLKLAAVHDAAGGTLTLFVLNRHLQDEMPLVVEARGFDGMTLERATTLADSDLAASNTKDDPERVRPRPLAGIDVAGSRLAATVPPASWSVIHLKA
jgi:alpha-N-arabinofuranosidase